VSQTMSKSLLPEFDHEMANTRKVIARVPEGVGGFAPHEKSMSLARLAGHVTEMPTLAILALSHDDLDLSASGGARLIEWYHFTTVTEALERFDRDVAKARALLAAISDERMGVMFTLRAGAHTVFTLPRAVAWRGFVMSHMIHHRAQLGVYLRLNNVAVPGLYGPSADEQ
jgi:uncharacterized damage-inducible protein DinB